jgi:hypothetical protein
LDFFRNFFWKEKMEEVTNPKTLHDLLSSTTAREVMCKSMSTDARFLTLSQAIARRAVMDGLETDRDNLLASMAKQNRKNQELVESFRRRLGDGQGAQGASWSPLADRVRTFTADAVAADTEAFDQWTSKGEPSAKKRRY